MTTPRKQREMPPGTAIAKLRALGTITDYVEAAADAARQLARDMAVEEYGKKVESIIAKVHPSVRDAVLKEAGMTGIGAEETDDAEDLPAGCRPLPPERAAIAEAAGRNRRT